MQSVSDLTKLRDSVIARCRTLQLLTTGAKTLLGSQDRRNLAFVTIELDNLVVLGLRQFTKSCLLGCRTAAGQRVLSSSLASNSEEAAAHIYRVLNPRGFLKLHSPSSISESEEIVFRNPKDVEKTLAFYGATNLTNISLALSLNANIFGEAKMLRHFFAHRAKNTYDQVTKFALNLGMPKPRMPEDLIVMGRPSTGVTIIDGWTADVINWFDLAC